MVCIPCVTIVLMQSKFVLLVAGTLEHPASMIFLAQGGIDWSVLFLLCKCSLPVRGPNVSPVVSCETWVRDSLLVSALPSRLCPRLLFWLA